MNIITMKPRAVRVAKIIGLVFVVYTIAINILINTPLIPNRFEGSDRQIHWGFAWTLMPGLLHVSDFRLTVTDDDLEWMLALESARFWVQPFALFARTFRATGLRGKGMSLRIRRRIDAARARTYDLEGLAPIPGYPDPPIRKPDPSSKPPYWTVHLTDIHVESIRDLWFDHYRYEGRGELRGGFYHHLKNELRVGPATLSLRSGKILRAREEIATKLELLLRCRIEEFHIKKVRGLAIWRKVTADARLTTDLPGLEILAQRVRTKGARVVRGTGSVRANIHVERGALGRASTFHARLQNVGVTLPDHRAAISGTIDGHVEQTAKHSRGVMNARFGRIALRTHEADEPQLVAAALAEVTASNVDLARPQRGYAVNARLTRGEISDLRVLAPYAPRFGRLVGGTGTLEGQLTMPPSANEARAEFELTGRRASLRIEELAISTDFRFAGVVPTIDFDKKRAIGSDVRLQIENLSVRRSEEDVTNWSGTLELPRPLLVSQPHSGTRFRSRVLARFRDARPILAVLEATSDPPDIIQRILELEGLHGGAELTIEHHLFELEDIRLEGNSVDVEGHMRLERETSDVRLKFSAGPLSLGMRKQNDSTTFYPFGIGW